MKALEEIGVLDRVHSPAVQMARDLLPGDASSLEIVHLRCAVTMDELAQLARIGHLRHLELLGELPSSTNIHSVADKLTEAIATLRSMPFANLTKSTVVGHTKNIFSLLKLLSVAVATTATTTTTTTIPKIMEAAMTPSLPDCVCCYGNPRMTDNTSVDIGAIVAGYRMSDGNADTIGNGSAPFSSIWPRTLRPLMELHLEFPLARNVLVKHLLSLEQLPTTLRSLDINTCRPFGHAMTPTTGITDANFVKLMASQPHLHSLWCMLLTFESEIGQTSCFAHYFTGSSCNGGLAIPSTPWPLSAAVKPSDMAQ